MEIKVLETWDEFGDTIRQFELMRQDIISENPYFFEIPLFRGIGSDQWGLQTTLERASPREIEDRITHLAPYYRFSLAAQAAIETFTDEAWEIPPPLKLMGELGKYVWAVDFFNDQVPVYRFFIYLRHHGYPSPLLDWTASPYVAAFFALDGIAESTNNASVYAILPDSVKALSSEDPQITLLGHHVRSHRRHMIQQSRYTVCMQWKDNQRFCSHDQIIGREGTLGTNGRVWRIDLPASERSRALRSLDLMNINAYSLFNTEDSLMRTLSRREGLFADYRRIERTMSQK